MAILGAGAGRSRSQEIPSLKNETRSWSAVMQGIEGKALRLNANVGHSSASGAVQPGEVF